MADELTARDAVNVKREALKFLDEVVTKGVDGFGKLIEDNDNLQRVFGVLKIANPDLLKDYKEFPQDKDAQDKLRETLSASAETVVEDLRQTKEKLLGKNGVSNMIGMLTDAYAKDREGLRVGAHLLGNVLNINPALVELGLKWLDAKAKAREQEQPAQEAETPPVTPPANENEPEGPSRGGVAASGGGAQRESGIIVSLPPGFTDEITIRVNGQTAPTAERGETHPGAAEQTANQTLQIAERQQQQSPAA